MSDSAQEGGLPMIPVISIGYPFVKFCGCICQYAMPYIERYYYENKMKHCECLITNRTSSEETNHHPYWKTPKQFFFVQISTNGNKNLLLHLIYHLDNSEIIFNGGFVSMSKKLLFNIWWLLMIEWWLLEHYTTLQIHNKNRTWLDTYKTKHNACLVPIWKVSGAIGNRERDKLSKVMLKYGGLIASGRCLQDFFGDLSDKCV